jgi:pimeloyl-ACP methyl ester carboxylesterase
MAESLDADSDAGAQAAPDPPRTGGATSFRGVKQIDAVDVAPLLAAEGCRVIVPYLRGYGTTRFRSGDTPRNAQQAALGADVIALMDALRIERATIAGCDWGATTANIVAALWSERCTAMVSVSGYLIGSREDNNKPLAPAAELQWWSDHVDIVIHNYRWRLGLAEGEAHYDALEQRLAKGPVIAVPSITLEGDANGAPHPPAAAYARRFSGKYQHRELTGGIGHNLPQEAPQAFAAAVLDAGAL